MSVEAAVIQYRQAMVDEFEQKVSVLRHATTKEMVRSGNQATFLVHGSNGATAVTRGAQGLIPYSDPNNTQKDITLVEKHAAKELTGFNIFASQGDQKAGLRKICMDIINREIDLTVLSALSSATIDTGASATASVAMVQKSLAELGNNDVDISDEDNLFGVVTPAFLAYIRQTPEFASRDYVDMPVYGGGVRKMLRWSGVNWMVTSQITGLGTSTEDCYLYHRAAIGYACNVGEDKTTIGYDDKHDISYARTSIFHGAVILQNSGIVNMNHDGSAYNLS